MESREMSKIPSSEEFARAKQRMRELDRNVDKVNESAVRYFEEICPIHAHKFYLLAEEEKAFRAYVFYKFDKDIQLCRANGVEKKLEDFVYNELELHGRGRREDIAVAFEFDSDENVTANYEGDYFLRLR